MKKRVLSTFSAVTLFLFCLFTLSTLVSVQAKALDWFPDVTFDMSQPGGWSLYNVDPSEATSTFYYDDITVYAIQSYEEADSIVQQVNEEVMVPAGSHENRSLNFTINNHIDDIDYYVVEIERYPTIQEAMPSRYIEAFTQDTSEFSMPTTHIDLVYDGFLGYDPEAWSADPEGEIPRFCKADSVFNDDGELQYVTIEYLFGNFRPKPGAYLEAHVLSPQSLCVLWNDTLTDNSAYKLDVDRWNDQTQDWSDEVMFTMPPDFAAYCVNELQAETIYRLSLFPQASSESSDTTFCIVKTLANRDLLDTDVLHQLPYAPLTGFAQEDNILAYTFMYGWKDDETYHFYDYLLIKKPDGGFSVHNLAKTQDSDAFNVMDVAIHQQSIYIAHSNEDIIKISLNGDGSISKQNLNLDFDGGYPKQIEVAGDSLYIANKFNSVDPSGSQPALGILDLKAETLSLHTHPNLATGADLLTVGENRVWLAKNDHMGSDIHSAIVRLRRNGDLEAPFFGELGTVASQSGIIDLKVNPDTGELIYLSPAYGLHGSYGIDYNSDLALPDGMTLNDVSCLAFDVNGNLIIGETSACMTHATPSTLESIVGNAVMSWKAFLAKPQDNFIGLAPVLITLPKISVSPQLVIGGLTLYAIASFLIAQSDAMASVNFIDFQIGVKDKTVDKETATEIDLDEFRRRYTALMEQLKKNPQNIPEPFPIKFPQIGDPIVPGDLTRPDEPFYDFALGKEQAMYGPISRSKFFVNKLRQGGYINPPTKEVIHMFNCELAQYFWGPYMKEHAHEFGTDYDEAVETGWTDENLKKTFFYLLAVFCEEIHFLYSLVDLDMVFNHEEKALPQIPTITEWELKSIKNNPYLLSKLNCYDYYAVPALPKLLVKLGECNACLDNDLISDVSSFSTSHDFGFSNGDDTDILPTLLNKSTAQTLYFKTQIASNEDSSAVGNLSVSIWNPSQTQTFEPSTIDGNEYTFYFPVREIPQWGEINIFGQGAPDDTVHSWFYYRLYQGFALRDSAIYTYEPSAAYLKPTAVMRKNASTVFFGEYLHRVLGEPANYKRKSYTYHIEADTPVEGEMNIFYKNLPDSKHLFICRWSSVESRWIPLPTELDPDSSLATAAIYQDGAYALCKLPEPDMPKPIAWYSFDHNLIDDKSGNELHGWIEDDVSFGPGISGRAAYLDGTDDDMDKNQNPDGIHLPADDLFDVGDGFSIAFWIKPTLAGHPELVIQKNHHSSSYHIDLCDGNIRATVKGPIYEEVVFSTVSSDIDINRWTHVAITCENGFLKLYIDGQRVDSEAFIPSNIQSEHSPIRLGYSSEGEPYAGGIDELLFYDYAISALDVQLIIDDTKSIIQECYCRARLWIFGLMNNKSSMSTRLNKNGILPDESPFGHQPINPNATLIDSLVDWVELEFFESLDKDPILKQSALISRSGFLCDKDGSTTLSIIIPPGSYFVRVNHRNHLPLQTATAVEFSPGSVTNIDFTSNSSGCTPDGMGQLDSGEHAMVPGDINGDGIINSRDYTMWYNQKAASGKGAGYLAGDLDGNGYVDGKDYQLWHQAATGTRTFVPPVPKK